MRDWNPFWDKLCFSYCERKYDHWISSLSDCQRDITGHLKMLKMRGDDVLSEKELIQLRAGKDIFVSLSSQFFPEVCNLFIASFLHIRSIWGDSRHKLSRVPFGIKWRGRKNICQVPEGVTSHCSRKHTGDRTISKKLSEEIYHNRYNALVTYLVFQTFLSVFRYLSAVRFLSRSKNSFLVREEKIMCGKTKDYAVSFFDPQSPSLRFSPLPCDSVTHVEMQWKCYRAEKRKMECLLLRPTV